VRNIALRFMCQSAVVVFGRRAVRPPDLPPGGWLSADQPVPLVTEFRYLGIVFHQTRGVSASVSALYSAGLRAMWGLLRRCGDMELRSLQIHVQLFDALVAPVLSYCSEVWGPTLLRNCRTPVGCMDNDLHGVQSLFMRQLGGGLRRSTPRQLLLREFGCKLLVRGWFHSMLSLWNRAVDMPASCIMKMAFVENLGLGDRAPTSWFQGFSSFLQTIGGTPSSGLCPDGAPVRVPVTPALECFDQWFYGCWADLPEDPRTAPSECVGCCKYQQWFALEGGPLVEPSSVLEKGRWLDTPAYVRCTAGMSRPKVRALASFRLCAHDLEVETLKWRRVQGVSAAAGGMACPRGPGPTVVWAVLEWCGG